jgi:hypothetical protein
MPNVDHRDRRAPTSGAPGTGRASTDATLGPGRRTLTMDLPPVQMRVTRDASAPTTDDVHAAAQHGTSGAGGPLPFHDRIQRAFGRHDISGVQAHTGAAAAEGTRGMGAEAYATGNAVAFGKAPDLHTAAHEAAHVVQQRAGVSLAGGVGAAGDSHEQHADAVADRVVAGGSAEALLDRYVGGGAPSTGVQRKITRSVPGTAKPIDLPNTYHKLKAPAQAESKQAADAVIAKAADHADLKAMTPAVPLTEIQKAWNRVYSSTNDFDLTTQADALAAALVASVKSSRGSAANAANRKGAAQQLTAPLLAENPDLALKPGARNPTVVAEPMATFDPPANTDDAARAKRTQTHISTVVLSEMGGEEAQASLAKDKQSVLISTNRNSVNTKLEKQLTDPEALRSMSATVANKQGLATADRSTAMNNRTMRHAMKLFARLNEHLDPLGAVSVPKKVETKKDGLHAEIRIDQSADYDDDTHHMPSGTKYPCAGCHLYFTEQGKEISGEMGPMWVTAPALSTQVGGLAFNKITDFGTVAQEIANQYKNAKAKGARMGMGKAKNGKPTPATNADSDSEYDNATFHREKRRMLRHINGDSSSESGSEDEAAFSQGNTQQSQGSHVPGFGALTLGSDSGQLDTIPEASDDELTAPPNAHGKRPLAAANDDEHCAKHLRTTGPSLSLPHSAHEADDYDADTEMEG